MSNEDEFQHQDNEQATKSLKTQRESWTLSVSDICMVIWSQRWLVGYLIITTSFINLNKSGSDSTFYLF